jgi:hypothetical protein
MMIEGDVNVEPFSMDDDGFYDAEGKFVRGEAPKKDEWFDEWDAKKSKKGYRGPEAMAALDKERDLLDEKKGTIS